MKAFCFKPKDSIKTLEQWQEFFLYDQFFGNQNPLILKGIELKDYF